MVHSEAVNIMLRKLVRGYQKNQSDIEPIEYDFLRYDKLPALQTLIGPGPITEEAEQLVTAIKQDAQSKWPRTFVVRVPVPGLGAPPIPIGPITGVYNLTYLHVELIGKDPSEIEWELWKAHEYDLSIAGFRSGEKLMPFDDPPTAEPTIVHTVGHTELNNIGIQRYYYKDWLYFVMGSNGPPIVDTFVQFTITLTEV